MAIETSEYIAMLRRMLRAGAARVGVADEVELAEFVALKATLEESIAAAVRGQRKQGRSWQEIANGVGTTRQAAQMRYGEGSKQK